MNYVPGFSSWQSRLIVLGLWLALLLSLGILVAIELYGKRSALGCTASSLCNMVSTWINPSRDRGWRGEMAKVSVQKDKLDLE